MSLFVLSSKDGWVNIMYDGLDAVGIDQQVRSLGQLLWVTVSKSCRDWGRSSQKPSPELWAAVVRSLPLTPQASPGEDLRAGR